MVIVEAAGNLVVDDELFLFFRLIVRIGGRAADCIVIGVEVPVLEVKV